MVYKGRLSREGLGLILALAILSAAAFLTRLLPLSISQYPFNNDSLTECGIAFEILGSGHLSFSPTTSWFGTHSIATPVFNVMIAFFASVLGVTPYECAQALVATLSVSTVGVIFLLARLISGDVRGGAIAAFAGLMMGTFVFTTGSVWKEALGMNLLLLSVLGFVRRDRREYRFLTFAILLVLPFVHHLVAAMALLILSFLVSWTWYFAIANGMVNRRHLSDLVMVLVPVVVVAVYYSSPLFAMTASFLSPISITLFSAGFIFLNILMILILSMKTHMKMTFAPFVGIGLFALVYLDYSGFIFPYSPSVSMSYLLLGASCAFLLSLAWYGAEVTIESKPMYRTILTALAIAPIAVLGFVLVLGFTMSSQKLFYRSFDFIDFFIFLGAGVGMVAFRSRRSGLYYLLAVALIVFLVVSFPFAYMSQELLGVRHDTQGYEIDAIEWMKERTVHPAFISDERIGYIGLSLANFTKYSSLPQYLLRNTTLSPQLFCMIEDSWTTEGVNDYPHGTYVLPSSNYTLTLAAANVFYLGGPANDRAIIFIHSEFGSATLYRHP